jgi:hypothetical protein
MLAVTDEIASFGWRGAGVAPLVKRLSATMVDEVDLLESLQRTDAGAA